MTFLKVWPGTLNIEVNQWRYTLLKSADMDPRLGIKNALALLWYSCLAYVCEHTQERGSIYTRYQRGSCKRGRKAELGKAVYHTPGCKHLFPPHRKELSLDPVEQPSVPQREIKFYHLAHKEQGQHYSARLNCSSCCNLGICWNALLHCKMQFNCGTRDTWHVTLC